MQSANKITGRDHSKPILNRNRALELPEVKHQSTSEVALHYKVKNTGF